MRALTVISTILAGALSLAAGEAAHRHDATVKHRFEGAERWAAVFDDPARDAWQKPEEVVGALGIGAGARVADIGAGTGYFSMRLAAAVGPRGKVYAVDIEPDLVEYVRERARKEGLDQVVPTLVEPDDPGLPEAGIDAVLICDTWHHIDDRLRYLERLAVSLAPGGRLAIIDFREGDLPVGPPAGHKLSREAVVAELRRGGWSLVREHDFLPYQYFLVFTPESSTDGE